MTQHGNKLPSLDSQQVRDQLTEESGGKALKCLTAAREYLNGLSPARIEAKYGWHEQKVYGWLHRFEERDFEDALYDDKPPGRLPELSDDQFDHFAAALQESPKHAGYDEPAWSSALAQQYLLEHFDIAHSQRHVSRLMNEAEMAYKKPRPQPASADKREREAFHETVEDEIGERDDNATVVTIDQLRKTVGADLTYAWFPIDERPTIDVTASREGINRLGALTEHGETLFLESNGSFTKEITVRFLQTLQEEFGENLIVVLDQAPYFIANTVKTFVEDKAIDLVYFPAGSPDLNPTEECWRQLRKILGNLYFGSLNELRAALWPALESIDPPGIYQYLCR